MVDPRIQVQEHERRTKFRDAPAAGSRAVVIGVMQRTSWGWLWTTTIQIKEACLGPEFGAERC